MAMRGRRSAASRRPRIPPAGQRSTNHSRVSDRGIAPFVVELRKAGAAVNGVKRPSSFGQQRRCLFPFRSGHAMDATAPMTVTEIANAIINQGCLPEAGTRLAGGRAVFAGESCRQDGGTGRRRGAKTVETYLNEQN